MGTPTALGSGVKSPDNNPATDNVASVNPEIVAWMMEIRNTLVEVFSFIRAIKKGYDEIIENIKLDNATVEYLTAMSETTIYRWRKNPEGSNLPYYMGNGACYYLFKDLYRAVKAGNLQAKNFNRMETLLRMRAYEKGIYAGANAMMDLNFPFEEDMDGLISSI